MAYIIAVCGAGGKTTYIKKIANELAKKDNKVCVTTTTHMFLEKANNYDVIGSKVENGKIAFPGQDEYVKICNEYDYVLVEADGSKSMPTKIPFEDREPQIPENVNEIVCIFGKIAVGRKIAAACHRYNEAIEVDSNGEFIGFNKINNRLNVNMPKKILNTLVNPNSIIDEQYLSSALNYFYIEPLKERYCNAEVKAIINDIEDSKNFLNYKKIALVVLASGYSLRFGSNKLFYKTDGKKYQYQIFLEKCVDVSKKLHKYYLEKFNHKIEIDCAIVTQYMDIINDKSIDDTVIKILNKDPSEGMSASIREGTKYFNNNRSDAICFMPCDLINLSENELLIFLKNYLASYKNIGCMRSNGHFSSPTIINNKFYDEALNVKGEYGLKNILKENTTDIYIHDILPIDIADLDTREDIELIK